MSNIKKRNLIKSKQRVAKKEKSVACEDNEGMMINSDAINITIRGNIVINGEQSRHQRQLQAQAQRSGNGPFGMGWQ